MLADHGSDAFLLMGVSEKGDDWLEEHTPKGAQTYGGAIIIRRFIEIVVISAIADGLSVGPLSNFRPME